MKHFPLQNHRSTPIFTPAILFLFFLACSEEETQPNPLESDRNNSVPGNNIIPEPENPAACIPTLTFFEQEIWDPFLGNTCFACHGPDGIGTQGRRFEMVVDDLPANLEIVRDLARREIEGKPLLLLKTSGEIRHFGGASAPEGSRNYQNLQILLERFKTPVSCDPKEASDS